MSQIFFILTIIAIIGVVISLFAGLFVMTRGKAKDKHASNKWMRARIYLQGLAVIFLILALLTAN